MARLKYFNPSTQQWEHVIVGAQGPQGDAGPQGDTGAQGEGIPVGGTAGQIISKIDGTDFNTEWIDNYSEQVKHLVKAAVQINKGQAVYVSSANGTNMLVSKASNSAEITSSKTLGIAASTMEINGTGFVITEGLISGINTSTATAGDPVWLGTSGNLLYGSANKPTAPNHLVFIGIVTRVNQNNGEIFVNIQNGFELDELHDVTVADAVAGDLLIKTENVWDAQSPSEIGLVTTTILSDELATKSDTTHNHDSRYYTETEVDTLLSSKSDNTHTHDDRYYTESEVNTLLGQKASVVHSHDDLYYTESEIDTKLALKATLASPTFTGTATVPVLTVQTSASIAAATITGAATVGTTLGITGNTTVGGTLGITGTTTAAAINSGAITATGNVNPQATNSYDLGTSSLRWRNIYTQDLHLSNGIGDYTVIEGTEELYLVNNNNGKHFKFALIEVDPSEVPAKSESD